MKTSPVNITESHLHSVFSRSSQSVLPSWQDWSVLSVHSIEKPHVFTALSGWIYGRTPCQSTSVREALPYVMSLRLSPSEMLMINTDFFFLVNFCHYLHLQDTFQFKQHVKVNFPSDDQSWPVSFTLNSVVYVS